MVNCWIYRKKKKDLPVPERRPCGRLKRDEGRSSRCHPFFKRRANGAPSFSPCVLRGGRSGSQVSLLRSRGAARFQPMARFSVRCFGYCSRSSPVFYTEPRKAGFVRLSSSGSECFSSPDRPSQGRGSEPRRSRCWWRQGCCACRTDAEDSCRSAHAAWP